MSALAPRYTLDDCQRIMAGEKEADLPAHALSLIQELAALVGAPTYVRTPVFTRDTNRSGSSGGGFAVGGGTGGRRRGNRGKQVSDEDWEAMRTFESTTRVVKEGAALFLDQVRKSVNKISDSNYSSQLADVLQQFAVAEDEYEDSVLKEGVDLVLKTASTKLFYVGLYARLVSDLYRTLPDHFSEKVDALLPAFSASLETIRTCDPNEEYDLFCVINEENERRRALGALMVALASRDVYEADSVEAVIDNLQDKIEEAITEGTEPFRTEELTEILYAMLEKCPASVVTEWESWDTVVSRVENVCANMKVKDFKGLSNKSLFKHMDVRDMLSKL